MDTQPSARLSEDHVGFTHGFVYSRNRIYIAAVSALIEDDDVHHGYVLRFLDGVWGHWSVNFRIAGLWVENLDGEPNVFVLGIDGRIQLAQPSGFRVEQTNTSTDSSSQLAQLNTIRGIGSRIYVAGMQRQVYSRSIREGPWYRSDFGMSVPGTSKEISGILSIDGTDPKNIYAVGFHGQIWHFDGDEWTKFENITNMKLECVRCLPSGEIIICGSNGLILRGKGRTWHVVENLETRATFYCIEFAFGTIFLSTAEGVIFRLDGSVLTRINFGIARTVTTRSLHYSDKILLSIGEQDLLIYDGTKWELLARGK